ncbi:immunity 53 family protein [Candidatus Albibeggiatoa sp. nov. BB20]|uniref:immunity 53 family protein n=1 Tax=Candidatus Albibeggiatoa sp. nov. BB20 TaxID=3162723 RepID=UPI00336589C1
MQTDYFNMLNQWYESQCDGEWEHTYGIIIETLDNPGWRVCIDMQDLEGCIAKFTPIVKEEQNGWVSINIQNGVFIGAGDPNKLEFIIKTFIELVENNDENFKILINS